MRVVHYYSAPWCTPCMRLKPLAKKLADEYGATLKVIDIEATPDIVPAGITGVPTIEVFRGVKKVAQLSPDMVNAQNMRKAFTS